MVGLRKILGDLRYAWGRVILLIIAVATGQAAMTASYTAMVVTGREVTRNFAISAPQEAMVEVTGFDPAEFDQLEAIPGVSRMEIMASLNARYQLSDGTWIPIVLFGRRDFNDLRALRVFPQSGAWPPRRGEVLIERSGMPLLQTARGEPMRIGFGRGQIVDLRFAGTVHDPAQAPSYQENALYGYVGLDTLVEIAGPRPLQFLIFLDLGTSAVDASRAVSEVLTQRGAQVVRVIPSSPTHPHADLMNGLLLLLTSASVLSFVVALFVSATIVSSLTQTQERQMAVLRALGASRLRIAAMQMGFVLAPALLGVLLGAVFGSLAARLLQDAIAWQLNLAIESYEIPAADQRALLLAGVIGIVFALAAPIASSVRKPVREVLQGGGAIRTPGLRLSALPPLEQMAFVEAFRRPMRTTVTVIALVLAGAGFLASANTYASLMGIVDRMLANQPEDISTSLAATPDVAALRAALDRAEAIERYEIWDAMSVSVSPPGAANLAGVRLPMISPPADTVFGYRPLLEGRLPSGPGEIVVGELAARRAGLGVGGNVTLSAGDRSLPARIVGTFDEWGMSIWTSEATYAQLAGPDNRARLIRATADPARLTRASLEIERAVLAAGSFPANTTTRVGFRSSMANHFLSFLQFLMVACLTAALVGAAALSASIGSNVLERTREIGVLRALGATAGTTFRLVLGQALSLSLVCLALAIAFSWPLSEFAISLLERNALPVGVSLEVSWPALGVLALGALVVALAASIAPAMRIGALPIRAALAHE